MTWVIGVPTMFGYSVGLADIQATLEYTNGKREYIDCIQKIFPVGKFLVAGFSGSVEIGYFLIEDLKNWLIVPDPTQAWMPDYVGFKWHKRARKLYSVIKPEKRRECSLLIIGVHPQKDNGLPGEAKTYACIMKSPDFKPEIIPPGRVGSIGSGNNIKEYMDTLAKLNTWYNPLMQMEVGNPGGYGQALAINLVLGVKNNPSPGISKHFHIYTVRRGTILLTNSNHEEFPNIGLSKKIEMPKVATNWTEFIEILKKKGLSLNSAEAFA